MTDPVRIASDLVRIGSVNPMGRGLSGPGVGEAALSDYLEAFLRDAGLSVWRQDARPGRQNVVARLDIPGARRSILFDVHQDTVPTDTMTIPPFSGELSGGKLRGRGACDVKGGMAAVLCAAARLAREKPRGAASVVLAFTVDEEHTFWGARRLMEGPWSAEGRGADRPSMAIVVEPTLLSVVVAHKGLARWFVRTHGKSSHGASPHLGVNAIYLMAPVLAGLEAHAASLASSPSPHPLLGRPTLNVGMVRGGTSVNTVPALCEVEIDRRLVPSEEPLAAFARCRDDVSARVGPGQAVEFVEPWMAEPALDTPPDSEVARIALEAAGRVTGPRVPIGVPYGTDGSTIAGGGIPTVVLGPGDIAQAHTEDEWIETDQIVRAVEVFSDIVRRAG